MNIADLMEIVRGSLSKEDFTPVCYLKDPEFVKEMKNAVPLPTYEQVEELAKKLEEPIERFYINLKTLFTPIVYFHNGFLYEIHAFDDEYLRNFHVKQTIKLNVSLLEENLKNRDYETYFIRMDSKVRIMMFKRLFNKIPDKDLFNIFLIVYTHTDYGFSELDRKLFARINKCKTKEQKDLIKQALRKHTDQNGYITVYRGVGSKSTPPEKAYSWTTSISTAAFFATRFSQTGDIYKGKIHLKDVAAYIDKRGEHEVLALPGDVKDIQQMEMLMLDKICETFPALLGHYAQEAQDIKSEYFLNPDSIHGVLHTKRVLFFSYIIGLYEGLNDTDMEILLTAAKYHDIGRTNDAYDETHGKASFEKMLKLRLVDEAWNKENIAILQFIVENHCIPDDQGQDNLENYPIQNKEQAVHLYKALKDADGLDRVRLGDTDLRYIRLPVSKRLPLLAQQIYQHMK